MSKVFLQLLDVRLPYSDCSTRPPSCLSHRRRVFCGGGSPQLKLSSVDGPVDEGHLLSCILACLVLFHVGCSFPKRAKQFPFSSSAFHSPARATKEQGLSLERAYFNLLYLRPCTALHLLAHPLPSLPNPPFAPRPLASYLFPHLARFGISTLVGALQHHQHRSLAATPTQLACTRRKSGLGARKRTKHDSSAVVAYKVSRVLSAESSSSLRRWIRLAGARSARRCEAGAASRRLRGETR